MVRKLSKGKARRGNLYPVKSSPITKSGSTRATRSGVQVGEVFQSYTAEGKPTKVRVVAKQKINLDQYVI